MRNPWQDFWLSGLNYLENNQYIQAKEMFENAFTKISKTELQANPEILINLIHTNFMLQNYDVALYQTKNLLCSYQLSDQQKLICGSFLSSILLEKGEEKEAVQAYFEYIANSPLAPKCHFSEDRIIINNIPSCETCKSCFKSFFIQEFCEGPADFHEYGNVWVIRKKNCQCKGENVNYHINKRLVQRDDLAIRGCCNNCSTLAIGATLACSYIPLFFL